MPAGKRMPKNRPTVNAAVRAVRAVQAIFENANLPFQEVELRNDLGKDAYVDLAEDGVHRGDMVAAGWSRPSASSAACARCHR